ncbi:MAG: hypothetical protein ACJAUG_003025 [Halioglobus sp.]|jgi:hypothetical protein
MIDLSTTSYPDGLSAKIEWRGRDTVVREILTLYTMDGAVTLWK